MLGPNINVPMMPEANAPALAALAKARRARAGRTARERALIEALAEAIFVRSEGRPRGLDAAYAEAMEDVARSAIPPTTPSRSCTPKR